MKHTSLIAIIAFWIVILGIDFYRVRARSERWLAELEADRLAALCGPDTLGKPSSEWPSECYLSDPRAKPRPIRPSY